MKHRSNIITIVCRILTSALATVVVSAVIGDTAEAASAPTVTSVSVDSVGATIATLQAKIVPGGADTAYRFEYGTTTGYGSVSPLHDADVGGGTIAIDVSQPIEGLSSGTTYHCRIVATSSQGTTVSNDETFSTFGIKRFEASIVNTDGSPDQQAGSHPYEVTTNFTLPVNKGLSGEPVPAGSLKDITVDLPAGLVGNPDAVPRCPRSMLASSVLGVSHCPLDTQVGLLSLEINSTTLVLPVYNLVPQEGVPAQFGVFAIFFPITMNVTVRTESDYGTTVSLKNLSELPAITGTSLTLWGVPADPSHDPDRGSCLSFEGVSTGSCPSGGLPTPFITMPTSCGSPLAVGLHVDSWAQPGALVADTATVERSGQPVGVTGCDKLDFKPAVSVRPDSTSADAPAGLTMDVSMPQATSVGLAEAALREAVFALPDGMSLNPAAADGLGACTTAQVMLGNTEKPTCPDSSKIGRAEVDTPLLPLPLTGSIYLARPNDNPFGSLLAAYMVAEGDGVVVKLPLELASSLTTGRISVKLTKIPELPFTHIALSLHGGPRAALASPDGCGTFTTVSQLTPYSAPEEPPQTLTSDLALNTGCEGRFTPSFAAGGTSVVAAQDTSFTLHLRRHDGQQHLKSLTATLPRGLLANLRSVPECGAAQAGAGLCAAASRVGTATIGVGAGSHPFFLSGAIFLTGPYKGSPFGLSIVLPTLVGPFDLGSIVVRAQVSLAPSDLHLMIIADSLPQIVDGIPLRLRAVDLTINRPGFLLNPTDCARQEVAGVVGSAEGASVSLHTPFQITGCATLPFAPHLSAYADARAMGRGNGADAGMHVKIALPRSRGANMRSLLVSIRGPIRPRLTTIQHACRAATFNADPAACPRGSLVGHASVSTTVLGTSLNGPIYLVFRGGSAYPDLMMVLQGEGISVVLDGVIQISNAGIIRTTFKNLPDVPLKTFVFDLPRGSDSILGFIGSPCSKPFRIRYGIVGHNGAQAKGVTEVAVKGCGMLRPTRIHAGGARKA
jgi:hypothetical protein